MHRSSLSLTSFILTSSVLLAENFRSAHRVPGTVLGAGGGVETGTHMVPALEWGDRQAGDSRQHGKCSERRKRWVLWEPRGGALTQPGVEGMCP